MLVTSVQEFRAAISKSGLLEESVVDELFTAAGPPSPNGAAEVLLKRGLLTPFQARMLLAGRHRGLQLGPYRVLEQLGRGGMGIVYLAEHQHLHRRVALKILPYRSMKDPLAVERFYREARAVAAVDHPNIVKAYDVGEEDKIHYLAMEYVRGVNLQNQLDLKGPLPWKIAAGFIAQACRGLAHAHERGLVHRDIKPGNLLVDGAGTVKILDLGLARCFHNAEDNVTAKFAQNEELTGSIDFMAPEVARGEKAIDIRSDIYSLGLTLYALILGKSPYEGTPAQKLLFHQVKELQPLHELHPAVPPQLSEVATRMTQKRPEDRYPHPAAVLDALAPWTPAAAAPPSTLRMSNVQTTTQAGSGTGSKPRVEDLPQALPEDDAPRTNGTMQQPKTAPIPATNGSALHKNGAIANKLGSTASKNGAPTRTAASGAPTSTAVADPDSGEEDRRPHDKPKRRRFKAKRQTENNRKLIALFVGVAAAVVLLPLLVVGAFYLFSPAPEPTTLAAAPPASGVPGNPPQKPAPPPSAPRESQGAGRNSDGNSAASRSGQPPAAGPGDNSPRPPAPPPAPSGPAEGVEVGSAAPEIDGIDLRDECFLLSDYKGSVVLLDFWGFWCPHCKKMIPHEVQLVDKMKSRPFTLLGVNSDKDANVIKNGLATMKVNWRSFKNQRTESENISKSWGVKGWPTLFLIDHNGVIREKWVGAPDEAVMNQRIEALVKEAEAARAKKG